MNDPHLPEEFYEKYQPEFDDPDLDAHEKALRERCNSDEPYKPSILFDDQRRDVVMRCLFWSLLIIPILAALFS